MSWAGAVPPPPLRANCNMTPSNQHPKMANPHHNMPQLEGGLRVLTLEEQTKMRKQKGLCPTCGEVRTHRPGIWKALMPATVENLVYKGICLRCNSLAAAKMKLDEPIDSIDMNYGHPEPNHHRTTSEPLAGTSERSGLSSQSDELREPTKKNVSLIPSGSKRKKAMRSFRGLISMKPGMQFTTEESNSVEGSVSDAGDNTARSAASKKNPLAASMPPVQRQTGDVKGDGHKSQSFCDKGGNSSSISNSNKPPAPNVEGKELDVSIEEGRQDKRSQMTRNNSETEKKTVADFRCCDCDGSSGFYTGTVVAVHTGGHLQVANGGANYSEYVPQGRGEMVYDEGGRIAKGVWSKGYLKIKVAADQERYEPYVLARYVVGDEGRSEDMVKKPTLEDISKLHVGDCAFIRRSGGSWSYAIVKSREDGSDPSITFQLNTKGSTKTVSLAQSKGNVRPPAKPDVLPGYCVGDPGCDEVMSIEPKEEATKSVSKLRVGDGAFVKRSDGSWAYALVVDRIGEGDDASLQFQVNDRGSSKVIEIAKCAKFVRRIRRDNDGMEEVGLSGGEAKALFNLMRVAERQQGRR